MEEAENPVVSSLQSQSGSGGLEDALRATGPQTTLGGLK